MSHHTEPDSVYSSATPFTRIVDGLSLATWINQLEQEIARQDERAIRPIPLGTLQADIYASSVLAMQNACDVEENEGELQRQVHAALQQTYTRWANTPPPPPYFRSRLLEGQSSVSKQYDVPFMLLGPGQRKIISDIVSAFLNVRASLMKS